MHEEATRSMDVDRSADRIEGCPRMTEACSVPLDVDSLHDLASPINQVRAMTELILKKYRGTLDEDGEAMLQFLGNAVQRLEGLLSGLKTYVRVVGNREAYRQCDGNALLASALRPVRGRFDEHAAVVSHEQLPELYCDPSQVSYALASLIENAIKFRGEQKPEISISVTPKENFWLFSIRDNGIGIDARNHERIFSVFKRVNHEAYGGSGMGLAITKQIIEQHGGRIWVESNLAGGATFYFTLPRAESARSL